MSVLIAFASKTGTAEKQASLLSNMIPDSVVVDITQTNPDLSKYDAAIIGGSIRMGKLHKAATSFIEKNRDEIMQKPYGLFISCGFMDRAETTLKNVFDDDMRSSAQAVDAFGGELDVSKQKGPDKMIVKMVTSATSDAPAPQIDQSRIERFAEAFQPDSR